MPPKRAVERSASMAPPTHPVESVAVVTPVVSLHQHLGQAAGMMRLGAHGDHTPLDEALHLCLVNQTSAKGRGGGGGVGIWLVEPRIVSFLFTYFTGFSVWSSEITCKKKKKNLLGQHRCQMFHFLQKNTVSFLAGEAKLKQILCIIAQSSLTQSCRDEPLVCIFFYGVTQNWQQQKTLRSFLSESLRDRNAQVWSAKCITFRQRTGTKESNYGLLNIKHCWSARSRSF